MTLQKTAFVGLALCIAVTRLHAQRLEPQVVFTFGVGSFGPVAGLHVEGANAPRIYAGGLSILDGTYDLILEVGGLANLRRSSAASLYAGGGLAYPLDGEGTALSARLGTEIVANRSAFRVEGRLYKPVSGGSSGMGYVILVGFGPARAHNRNNTK